MAPSFEREIDAFLQHRLEQLPPFQRLTTTGDTSGTLKESIETLAAIVLSQRDAIIMVAREIDKLRADISP
jgi:hypothetical protein